jgi:hypothetical protein
MGSVNIGMKRSVVVLWLVVIHRKIDLRTSFQLRAVRFLHSAIESSLFLWCASPKYRSFDKSGTCIAIPIARSTKTDWQHHMPVERLSFAPARKANYC